MIKCNAAIRVVCVLILFSKQIINLTQTLQLELQITSFKVETISKSNYLMSDKRELCEFLAHLPLTTLLIFFVFMTFYT